MGARAHRALLLAALLAAPLAGGCDPPGADGGDVDADADADADTDADADSDCSTYPAGPYDWDLDEVVSMVQFPAVYGSGGAPTLLDMCAVFRDADEVKSIVFVVGSTTCSYCPTRFAEIGAIDLAAHHAEKAALYYNDETGNSNVDAATMSEIADTYGWVGGWRISDTGDQVIFNGGYPDWLWETTPNVFILDAHSMRIVAAEKGDAPEQLDVHAEVAEIDAAHP